MIISYVKDNKLFLVFQDFEENIDSVYDEIKKFPPEAFDSVKEILDKNFFDKGTLERQTHYVNSITSYIDAVTIDEKQYYFFLYIVPKDVDIDFNGVTDKEEQINFVERLLIKLFKLYSSYATDSKSIEVLENFSGENFLQLEAEFYLRKLDKLYGTLLNYKLHYKNKIICSDKVIGEPITELNMLESNPLKTYQFIKAPYQKDLIKYVFSCIKFLEIYRLEIFKENEVMLYSELLKRINKINNLLLKISSTKKLQSEHITNKTLHTFFKKYKNNSEIKHNRKIYNLIKTIFFTELQNDIQLYISIDLTQIFEKILESKLIHYGERLFIGDEKDTKKILRINRTPDINLNNINFLLEKDDKQVVKQFPDFMIKENNIYNIVDAKYKFKENVLKRPDDIRQVLIYSLLFNKDYFELNHHLNDIKKIIIYVDKSNLNIQNIDDITINNDAISLYENQADNTIYNEKLFNSEVILIPCPIFKQTVE